MIDVTGRFPIPLEWPRLAMGKVDAIVVHHTAVDPRTGEPGLLFPAAQMTVEDELNHIAVIHLYHKSKGFGGFGYHFIVFPSGRAYLVTPLTQWGAHVGGENDHLWGIAFAGDFTSRLPGPAQIRGGRDCVEFCGVVLPINPHKAYGGTTCPGRLVEILDQLREGPMTIILRKPIVGIAARPQNDGYWMAAADGGVFGFGNAYYYGCPPADGITLADENLIVGIEATPSGKGYWLVGADGGIFTYGDALNHGSVTTS